MPNPSEPLDHHPIEVTSTTCKLSERIICKTIMSSIGKILLTNKQFCFQPGYFAMDAIIQVIDDLAKQMIGVSLSLQYSLTLQSFGYSRPCFIKD